MRSSFFENRNFNLNGRKATQVELDLIEKHFNRVDWIDDYQKLIRNVNIIGATFELSKISDLSGTGVDMEWMSAEVQIDEAFNFYPGLIVVEKSFIPVGICLQGSGNPYFLRIEDENWKIYRILHDFNSFNEKMVEYVTTLEVLMEIGN